MSARDGRLIFIRRVVRKPHSIAGGVFSIRKLLASGMADRIDARMVKEVDIPLLD
jgi:hypothetical protein